MLSVPEFVNLCVVIIALIVVLPEQVRLYRPELAPQVKLVPAIKLSVYAVNVPVGFANAPETVSV
jgi:hypothetical protein